MSAADEEDVGAEGSGSMVWGGRHHVRGRRRGSRPAPTIAAAAATGRGGGAIEEELEVEHVVRAGREVDDAGAPGLEAVAVVVLAA